MPGEKVLLILAALLLAASGCVQESPAEADVLFCPWDNCAEELVERFGEAEESISVAIYSFTNQDIADALVDAGDRGVKVLVLFDSGQAESKYSVDEMLLEAGVAVKLFEKDIGIMHHKFAVIDGKTVATGSFNYSKSADLYNNENLVFLYSEGTAQRYEAEFQQLWEAG